MLTDDIAELFAEASRKGCETFRTQDGYGVESFSRKAVQRQPGPVAAKKAPYVPHAVNQKLSAGAVRDIRTKSDTISGYARKYGVARTAIRKVQQGKTYKDVQ